MTVLILNAPPSCGKDTIANLLRDSYKFAKTEFKHSMFQIAIAMSGMTEAEFMAGYHDRDKKEQPQKELGGLTYREFMIHISEDIMKPLYGDDVFGKRAAQVCVDAIYFGHKNVVFSDGGFIDEVKVLHEEGLEVIVIRLHRDGYTFVGDSRRYIYPDFCRSFDVTLNEGMPHQAVQEILEKIK